MQSHWIRRCVQAFDWHCMSCIQILWRLWDLQSIIKANLTSTRATLGSCFHVKSLLLLSLSFRWECVAQGWSSPLGISDSKAFKHVANIVKGSILTQTMIFSQNQNQELLLNQTETEEENNNIDNNYKTFGGFESNDGHAQDTNQSLWEKSCLGMFMHSKRDPLLHF